MEPPPVAVRRRSTLCHALEIFGTKILELTNTTVDGSTYVLVKDLKQWMRSWSHTKLDDKPVTNTDLLVHAAYFCEDGDKKKNFSPINASRISDSGDDCCVIVFSILLDLNLGHLIDEFSSRGIVDRRLPEELFSLRRNLRDLRNGEEVAERFNERQWRFSPAIFGLDMDKQYFENWVIPICRKSSLGSGGTAHVWQIVVQSQFVDQKLRNLLDKDTSASYLDKDYGQCYIFALKTFEDGNFQHYRDEKAAFDGLRHNRGVIRRLGCYSQRLLTTADPNGNSNGERLQEKAKDTMNLLLEFGTLDLRLLFGHQTPPMLPDEILAFWKALFEVAEAVNGIHDFKTGGREFNGWHADIKPENIIHVRGKYKLADPGFARFKNKNKVQDKSSAPQIRVHGGTDTYGAPEVSSQAAVHQTIDIWSLGCVFSMAATWVVSQYQGVVQYQRVREKAINRLLQANKQDDHPLLASRQLKVSDNLAQLDCFHDGSNVLKEVTGWHVLLRRSIRRTDPITEKVLDLIDQDMLLQDPKKRIGAGKLCKELQNIVSWSRKEIDDCVTAEPQEMRNHIQHMEGLLREIDQEAPTEVAEEAPPEPSQPFAAGLPVNRDALKAQLEHVALKKTSHRFEAISEPRSTPGDLQIIVEMPNIVARDTMGVQEVLHHSQTQHDSVFMPPVDRHNSFQGSTFSQPLGRTTGTSILTYPKSVAKSSAQPFQNVIQARETMERDLKRKSVSLGGMFPKKRPRKDVQLSKYFKNRDIKFLVDDAETMSEHWDVATFVLETLVMKACDQDPDGPDLIFANDPTELKSRKYTADFRKAMEKVRPNPHHCLSTNIRSALEPIFNDYLSMVERTKDKSRVRALTVIILTDGLWAGMTNQNDIIPKIIDFYKKLKDEMHVKMRDRQVSIQFIQFGDDEEARERLRRLDDDMPNHGIEDIIDHEKFSVTGNIFKMLLGSFIEVFDAIDDSDEDLSSPASPEASPSFQATGFTPPKNLPLRPIAEDLPQSLPSPVVQPSGLQRRPSAQPKAKKSRPFSGFFS